MNQQIQKLLQQATDDIMGVPVIDHAKFAQLIVRECSDFLKDTLDDHFAAEQLEEHFGVEE